MRKRPQPEITPEMIEAGVSALLEFHGDFEREEDAVMRIYTAMAKAAPSAESGLKRQRNNLNPAEEPIALPMDDDPRIEK